MATAGSYASGPGPMIYIWDTKGRVLETHPMPVGVDTPTNCTFGDPTSARSTSPQVADIFSGSATRDDAAGSSGHRCGGTRDRGTEETCLFRFPLLWERELQSNTPT